VTVRRAARTDATHAGIVKALRAVGCSVLSMASLGGGVPDLLVARSGRMWLVEVKSPAGPRGGISQHGQRVNELQVAWQQAWRAPVSVARSVDEALRIVGAL
jgi:hypothetical protein